MVRWEFTSVQTEDRVLWSGEIDARLNQLGEQGWELVGLAQRERHGYSHELYFVFSRPLEGAAA